MGADSVEQRRQPVKQVSKDFAPVDFIKHFVASTGVEIMTDVANTRLAMALYERFNTFELLANGVFAT